MIINFFEINLVLKYKVINKYHFNTYRSLLKLVQFLWVCNCIYHAVYKLWLILTILTACGTMKNKLIWHWLFIYLFFNLQSKILIFLLVLFIYFYHFSWNILNILDPYVTIYFEVLFEKKVIKFINELIDCDWYNLRWVIDILLYHVRKTLFDAWNKIFLIR